MGYEGKMQNHHYLYCSECDIIEDFYDEDLDRLLKKYFKEKTFRGFHMENIILQI
jgi:Fe2+ or Zn2+ uptake regulation protein